MFVIYHKTLFFTFLKFFTDKNNSEMQGFSICQLDFSNNPNKFSIKSKIMRDSKINK